jgi:DNA-binding XRE family transcriptional regulator
MLVPVRLSVRQTLAYTEAGKYDPDLDIARSSSLQVGGSQTAFLFWLGGDVSGSCVSMVCKLEIAHDVLLTGLRSIMRGGVLSWD